VRIQTVKGREFQKFASSFLIPQLPGFVTEGHLIFRVPVENVIRGFIFDSSAFSAEAFHPTAFVQPLYVPHDHITMTLGSRLRGAWEFSRERNQQLADRLLESMRKEGLPLLEELGSPQKIADSAEVLFSTKNHYVRQAAAYSLVLIAEDRKAVQRLDQLLLMLKEMGRGVQTWAQNVYAEVAGLRETVLRDPSEARALLEKWAEKSRQALRLPE
jgi:hypothetical protein